MTKVFLHVDACSYRSLGQSAAYTHNHLAALTGLILFPVQDRIDNLGREAFVATVCRGLREVEKMLCSSPLLGGLGVVDGSSCVVR